MSRLPEEIIVKTEASFIHVFFFYLSDYMRCFMRKVCAYEKTKAQMSCIVIAADRRFCFPTKIDLSVYFKVGNLKKSNRKAMNSNWSNQKANPALKTKAGNK